MRKLFLLIAIVASIFSLSSAQSIKYIDVTSQGNGDGSSWSNASSNIADMIEQANENDQIWISEGVYVMDTTITIDKGIKIYGGFSGTETILSQRDPDNNITILSGDAGTEGVNTDNTAQIFNIFDNTVGVVIDGITIRDAYAPNPKIIITTPLTLQGNYDMNLASFGPSVFQTSGSLAIADPLEACSSLTNDLTGKIALIQRGTCAFTSKALAAQEAGALAVIIYNNVEGDVLTPGGDDSNVTIPVIGISKELGESITAEINSGSSISVELESTQYKGAAINLFNGILHINNCKFIANEAYMGGGIFCDTSLLEIKNSEFTENTAYYKGGGIDNYRSDIVMDSCVFKSNSAEYGGGMNVENSTSLISNCILIENEAVYGGAGIAFSNGKAELYNSFIFKNTTTDETSSWGTGGGIQISYNNNTKLTNVVFAENQALGASDDGGGAIMIYSGSAEIINSTFYRNTSATTGSAISNLGISTTNISNSVFWENTASLDNLELYAINNDESLFAVNYCNIVDYSSGTGNISVDPQFTLPENPLGSDNVAMTADDGLKLQGSSPLRDAGDPSYDSNPQDILGELRTGIYDIGAYEYPTYGETCELAKEATQGTNSAIFILNDWGEVENDQWYTYTPDSNVVVTISSCDLTDADTRVYVISGCDWNEEYAENDDACDAQSRVSFNADEGITYYIKWESSDEGTVPWTLTERSLYKGETEKNALIALPGTNFSNHWEGGSEAYFLYTATENGYVEISSCNMTDVDTYVEVYKKSDETLVAEDDDFCNLQSKVSFEVTAGEEYYILWQDYYIEAITSYPWELTFTTTPPDPGTSCANPLSAVEGINNTVFENYLVFYEYTASITGKLMLYSEPANSDIEFYLSSDCNYYENEIPTYYDGDTTVAWVTQGEKYIIITINEEFYNSFSVTADWILEIRDEEREIVPGMTCMDAITVIEGLQTTDNSYGDMWYKYTASETGYLMISSCGLTQEDTYLSVYNDCNYDEIDYSDDECNSQSALTIQVEAGEDYLIKWGDEYTSNEFNWELTFFTGTEFLSYDLDYQAGASVIDETNHTISVDVSFDADLTSISQYFEVIEGATVKINGTAISDGQSINFSDPVTYTIIAPDGTTQQDWVVTVNQNSAYLTGKDILSFDMEYSTGEGVIDGTTIDIELEYGYINNCPDLYFELSPLATLEFNSDEVISGSSWCVELSLGENTFMAYAEDGTSKTWTVNISETAEPPGSSCENATATVVGQNSGVAITSNSQWFKYTPSESGQLLIELLNDDSWTNLFAGCEGTRQNEFSGPGEPAHFIVEAQTTYYFYFESNNDEYIFNLSEAELSSENDIKWFALDVDIKSLTIDNVAHTISITVPYETNIAALETELKLSAGATAYMNEVEQDISGEIINFNSPVTYSIEAMDGTIQEWIVTVDVDEPKTGNSIRHFTFGEALAPATINEGSKTVNIWVGEGTDLSEIVPYFVLSEKASMYLNSNKIVSGYSSINLVNPLTVSVEAEDGTKADWTINVKSSDATSGTDIISFKLSGQETIEIDEVNHNININLTPGTKVESVIAVFELSPNASATIGDVIQTSGVTVVNFTSPVTYTIKAQDGSTQDWTVNVNVQDAVLVTSINVSTESGNTSISTPEGTLQMVAEVLPENATDKDITWSVINETGDATITAGGLLTAKVNGTVLVTATANDGSEISGELQITISGQPVDVTLINSITVSAEGGDASISTFEGTLQLAAEILPENATDKSITWSITNETGTAEITSNGLVTAQTNGTVKAVATANDGSGVTGELVITITGQETVGIQDVELSSVNIYPNPARSHLNIEFLEGHGISRVQLTNIVGRTILNRQIKPQDISVELKLDGLTQGIYIVTFSSDDQYVFSRRIIVTK